MGRRNFYSIPTEILAKLNTFRTNLVEVGLIIKCNEENISSYSKFGITIENGKIVFKENQLLPPHNLGRYCRYNSLGRIITRKDLPKVSKAIPYELRDWGGYWHYGTYPKLVYQKEIWYPEDVKLVFNFIKKIGNEYFIKISIDNILSQEEKNFEFNLLYYCNILQECFGSCDIFSSEMNKDDYINTLYIDWVIFPPGEATAEIIYNSLPENPKKPPKEEFIDRYETIIETRPVQFIQGQGKFKSYFGATYKNGITVFENVYWGNALYVIYEDWTEITQKSRSELLRLNPIERNFLRIVHNKNWKDIFKRAII